MRIIFQSLSLFACLVFASSSIQAGGHGKHGSWVLAADQSRVAYGSIKKDVVGEVNHFKTLSGKISKAGDVELVIDLASVETNIGIRNERMIKHVFNNTATATLKAKVDINAVKKMASGSMKSMDVTGTLSFLGKDIQIKTSMVVVKLTDKRVIASTDSMVMLKTAALGVDAGVDKLMQLAGLPGITRVAPVTLRLVFDMHK